jgi:hypothetical protein
MLKIMKMGHFIFTLLLKEDNDVALELRICLYKSLFDIDLTLWERYVLQLNDS